MKMSQGRQNLSSAGPQHATLLGFRTKPPLAVRDACRVTGAGRIRKGLWGQPLRAIPEGALEVSAMEGSPTIAQSLADIHFVRLVFVLEDAPEFARPLPKEEWRFSSFST